MTSCVDQAALEPLLSSCVLMCPACLRTGPSATAAGTNGSALHLSAEEEALFTGDTDDDEDDDLDDNELDALEASLAGASVK